MTTAVSQRADKLDFKRILPIITIVFVDLLGLSIIIPLLPLYAARFSATPLVTLESGRVFGSPSSGVSF